MPSDSKKVIYAAMAGNAAIAVSKFGGFFYTGSSAMLSESFHSMADTGNQMLMLWGLKRSKKPANEKHPFGHGKEIYFWCFVVAMVLFGIGAGLSVYEGITHLLHPEEPTAYWVNYLILGAGLIFEGQSWVFALLGFRKQKREDEGYVHAVRRGKDPTRFLVLFEDSAALLGLLIAILGLVLIQTTGWVYWDGIASILIGLVLGVTALWLGYETKGLLIGETAVVELQDRVRQVLEQQHEIKTVNELLAMHMGPQHVLVNASLDFIDGIPAEQVEKTIGQLNDQIKTEFPEVQRIFLEIESWQKHRTQQDQANQTNPCKRKA